MEYQYGRELGSDEIRLLHPTIINERVLFFTVIETSRKTVPSYTAVSYTWGNGNPSKLIYLNGKAFLVRDNLWFCLYHLCHDAGAIWNNLWVDAICINQSNDTEKTAQVRRMDRTYRDAAVVSVWLGLPNNQSVDYDLWMDSMKDMANRPYWSRCWVIQEFLLAKHIVICCGDARIGWELFHDLLCDEADIQRYDEDFGRPGSSATRVVYNNRALPLVMGRHVDKYPENRQSLADLLVSHHRSECKDPRDRIFSLVGLITEMEQVLLERFFPDYSMETDHVHIIALAHIMQCASPVGSEWINKVTPESDELFLGLGGVSRAERARLLKDASIFDYLGEWRPADVKNWFALFSHDAGIQSAELDELGWGMSSDMRFLNMPVLEEELSGAGIDWEFPNPDFYEVGRRSRCSKAVLVICVFVTLAVGIYYFLGGFPQDW